MLVCVICYVFCFFFVSFIDGKYGIFVINGFDFVLKCCVDFDWGFCYYERFEYVVILDFVSVFYF